MLWEKMFGSVILVVVMVTLLMPPESDVFSAGHAGGNGNCHFKTEPDTLCATKYSFRPDCTFGSVKCKAVSDDSGSYENCTEDDFEVLCSLGSNCEDPAGGAPLSAYAQIGDCVENVELE